MDKKTISQVIISGAVLGIAGIGVFILLWLVFADVAPFLRVVIAVCVPPTLMAGGIGVYMLFTRPKNEDT